MADGLHQQGMVECCGLQTQSLGRDPGSRVGWDHSHGTAYQTKLLGRVASVRVAVPVHAAVIPAGGHHRPVLEVSPLPMATLT